MYNRRKCEFNYVNIINPITIVKKRTWTCRACNGLLHNGLSNEVNIESNKIRKNLCESFIPAQGSKMIKSNLKTKADDELGTEEPKIKKIRTSFGPTPEVPIGFIWDSADYSCSYDSLFTILCEIWIYNRYRD